MVSTREKILHVSYKLFSEQGYAPTSLSQIAQEVGIQKASIFSHFRDKGEIFAEVLCQKVKDYETYIDSVFREYKEEDVEVLYYKYIESIIAYLDENMPASVFWFRSILFPSPLLTELVKIETTPLSGLIKEHITYIIEKGIQCGIIKQNDTDMLLKYFFHLLYGNFALYLYNYSGFIKCSDLRYISDMFWKGITS